MGRYTASSCSKGFAATVATRLTVRVGVLGLGLRRVSGLGFIYEVGLGGFGSGFFCSFVRLNRFETQKRVLMKVEIGAWQALLSSLSSSDLRKNRIQGAGVSVLGL